MPHGRVLVVADDASFASFLLAGLRGEGYEAHQASSGSAAEALDRSHHFDLVLLDHRLALGGVNTLVRDWRSNGRTMPIILLTERAPSGERAIALAAGITAFLPKPFPLETLFSMVQVMLGS